jgi:hypothetical protein
MTSSPPQFAPSQESICAEARIQRRRNKLISEAYALIQRVLPEAPIFFAKIDNWFQQNITPTSFRENQHESFIERVNE